MQIGLPFQLVQGRRPVEVCDNGADDQNAEDRPQNERPGGLGSALNEFGLAAPIVKESHEGQNETGDD